MNIGSRDFNNYSFIAVRPDGTVFSEERPDAHIETASSIKSPIANVALRLANRRGIDASTYSMAVTEDHIPHNATTFMQDTLDEHFSLNEIVERTIVQSDATATNMLIDFLSGREGVNVGLGRIGLHSTRLLEEKLDLVELQEPDSNPLFGISTVRELADYYKDLMENSAIHPWAERFISLHSLLKNVRLFSTKADYLREGVKFAHKTGSIFSMNIPQASMIDAGKLTTDEFPEGIYVAGAYSVYREGGLARINTEFAEKNCAHLGIDRSDICDHPIPEKVAA